LRKALLVQIQHVLRGHRFALQRAQHLAIVRRRKLPLGRQRRRHLPHLLAHFGKGHRAERDRLLRRDIDPYALQAIGIKLGRQCRRRSRARQHGAAHPVAMRAQLPRQALVRRLPALHRACAEQLGDAGDVALAIVERLLHFAAIGPDEPGIGALERAFVRELRNRPRARRHARIAAQPLERVQPARIGIALVEHDLQALEDFARQVAVGNKQPLLERRAVPLARDRIHEDVQVLAHAGILFLQARGTQARRHRAERRIGALDMARLEIAHLGVVALEAELRHPLGKVAAERLEHLPAVPIARLDPGAVLRRRHIPHCDQHDGH